MLRFTLGASIIPAWLLAWALIEPVAGESGADGLGVLAGTIFGAPVVAAWIVAELLHALTPRRLLRRPGAAGSVAAIFAGLAAGGGGAAIAVAALPVADALVAHDALLTASAGALGAFLVVFPMTRLKRGACAECGYDLAGATPSCAGRCPECGAASLSAG